MTSDRALERRRVVYRGRVQGVGFRATAADIAGEHPVTGFVRNQADGSVELEAQGAKDDVERFLSAVVERFIHHIRDVEHAPAALVAGEATFEIRF
jgi:acylphosphatase